MDRKRVTVIRIGPVISTKEALYFVGSMVLFFLLKPVFGGLHCFACTVFRLLQAVPIQPPTFDFTPFSKRNALNKSGIQLF